MEGKQKGGWLDKLIIKLISSKFTIEKTTNN